MAGTERRIGAWLPVVTLACASPETMDVLAATDQAPALPDVAMPGAPDERDPCLNIRPGVLDFDDVLLDASPTLAVTFANPCGGELLVSDLTLEDFDRVGGPSATLDLAIAAPFVLTRWEPLEIQLRARPIRFGRFHALLQARSNDPAFPDNRVIITGRVVCEGSGIDVDSDSDTVPDGCDVCAEGDDRRDADFDGTPDACDLCAGFDDRIDADGDSIPDGCDDAP